jgi:hypothetical protein
VEVKMKNLVFWLLVVGLVVACSKNPCDRLKDEVCSKAGGTPACDRAQRTSNKDQCAGFLKDVDKFIALSNEKVETPPLQPPKREPVATEQKDATAVTDGAEPRDATSVSDAEGAKTAPVSTEKP